MEDRYKLHLGDCLDVLKTLGGGSVHCCVTSPPYDDLRTYEGSHSASEFAWREIIAELYRVTKPGGVVVWVVADATVDGSETGTSFRQALHAMDCGFRLHDTMIYEKPAVSFPEATRYYPVFEYMFVWSKGAPKVFNPIVDRVNVSAGRPVHSKERQKDGTMKPKPCAGNITKTKGVRFNVWRIPNAARGIHSAHPATFPLALARDHIQSWSNKGAVILDPFMGSGTTGVAALQMGCKFIGCEIEPKYFNIAKRRIEREARQKTLDFGGA